MIQSLVVFEGKTVIFLFIPSFVNFQFSDSQNLIHAKHVFSKKFYDSQKYIPLRYDACLLHHANFSRLKEYL